METTNEPKTLFQLDQAWTDLGQCAETIENYHGAIGMSFSGLKKFAKTPATYILTRDDDSEETTSQRVGTLAHMAILEPERFETTVVSIEGHRGGKEVKAAIAEAEARGKYVCKPEEYENSMRISRMLRQSKTARALLSNGVAEQSIRWRDQETGVLLKCRPDYLREDGVTVDVKTFDDLSDNALQGQIYRMRYHWQSQLYLTGAATVRPASKMFAHLFVEPKTGLFRIIVLDDASLDRAESGNDKEIGTKHLIQKYANCLKANEWPGYSDEIATLNLPSYAW